MMRFYFTFNRGSRAHPMPHTLEGLKIAEESKMNSGGLIVAMMLAIVVGILAAFWAYLVVGYEIGVVSGLGTGGYNLLQSWLYHPTDTDVPGVVFTGFGFCFTGFLWWLRTRFLSRLFIRRATSSVLSGGRWEDSGFRYSSHGQSRPYCSKRVESACIEKRSHFFWD